MAMLDCDAFLARVGLQTYRLKREKAEHAPELEDRRHLHREDQA